MAKFYPFDAIIAFWDFYVYKDITWLNVKVEEKAIDPLSL